MRLFEIPRRPITAFGSAGVTMDFLPPVTGSTGVHVAHLAAGGTLGRHPAVDSQIFAILSGEGEVQTADAPRRRAGPGVLVVWEAGEVHQTWAITDLTAVIVETSSLPDLPTDFRELPEDPRRRAQPTT
jgi:quercetin dioxygenase-like cupin family protein